ncbi:uncharacterized protein LOC111231814 [Seriola dumerili]|uniref:uncharacterized protein LOC111231814 n=1 Tax=Seriola dumerili TaxID=41447 RepID=UPI000BBF047A|nr:uncharacterized protein LOC111231814 [Seriola dumerili]
MTRGVCVTNLLALLVLVAQLFQLSSAAAESSSSLKCNVTQQSDATFRYQLTEPPLSSRCTTCWEDHNKTVIARNADHVPNLVQTLTNQSIVLKSCLEHLTYIRDCSGVRETTQCKVNCSLYLEQDLPPCIVNTSLICLSKTQCLHNLIFGLVICVIVVAVVIVGLVIWFVISKCSKRRRLPVSYTPAAMTQIGKQIRHNII